MEQSIITFENPDTKGKIKLSLKYNKKTSDIDYDVEFVKGYEDKKAPMDFNCFLVQTLIRSLQFNKDE